MQIKVLHKWNISNFRLCLVNIPQVKCFDLHAVSVTHFVGGEMATAVVQHKLLYRQFRNE